MTRCALFLALALLVTASGPAPAAAAAPFLLDIVPNDTTVTAGDFAQYTVVVVDEVGDPAPTPEDRTVGLFPSSGAFYLPGNHATPITQLTIPTGEYSVRVDYRATLADDHTLTMLTTDAKSPFLGGNTGVTVEPAAVSASASTISASSPVTADGVAQSSVVVTSKDAFGNLRSGDNVVVDANGSALEFGFGSTNSSGQSTGFVTDTEAELVTVSATVAGQPLSSTAIVNFVAGPVDADSSTVSASSPVVANGASTSAVVVTARDAQGNPIAGASVSLSVSPPADGAVLTQPGGVTNASGQATGTLSSTKTGNRVVRATVATELLSDSAVVLFVPGVVASFQWTVDGAAVAGQWEDVTLTARDGEGNVVTNYTGTVSLSTTSGGVGDAIVEWSAPAALGVMTNVSGGDGDQATYQFAAGDNGSAVVRVKNTRMETFRLDAAAGGASGQSANIVVAHAPATQIEVVSGDAQSATVMTAVALHPTVLVTDAFDNPVGAATVTFDPITPNSSADVVAGGGVQLTGLTNASGILDCDVWTLAETAGTNVLRASIGAGTPFVDFTATGTPDVGNAIAISPLVADVTVGSSTVVTLTLTDQHGNLVSGERVDVFIKAPADGTLSGNGADPNPTTGLGPTARWGNTDADGQITVLYVAPGTADRSDNVDASTSLVNAASVPDAVYTTTASGQSTNLRITFVGGSTAAAGASFEFLVEAVDGGGNVDTGNTSTVTLAPEASSGLVFSETDFGPPLVTQVTLAAGAATVYGRGEKAGVWDITVSGGGLTADTEPVTIVDTGVIDHYAVIADAAAVAGVSFNVSVQARDVFDNLVDNAANQVNLTAVDAADSTQPASAALLVSQATLVSGQVTVGESYTVAESIRIKVAASGKEGFSGTVQISAADAHRLNYVSGNNSGVVAGDDQALVAEVLDAFDNPVAGELVTFVRTTPGGALSSPSGTSASDGRVSVTLTTSTTAGNNGVKASILDENPAGLERVDFLVQTVAGSIDYYTVTPAKTVMQAGEVVAVTVAGFDANDNLATLDNTTSVDLTSDGDMEFASSTGTLIAGIFATTMSDTVAQSVVVTAEKSGGGPTGSTPTLTVTNAPAYRVAKISGDGSVTVGASQPLVVEVRDAYTNVVPGTFVTFTLVPPGGPDGTATLTEAVVATASNGRATTTLNTAQSAGSNVVEAKILDGSPPSLEKVTFTVTTAAGGIHHYDVVTNVSQQTAGLPVNVTVQARDASNNLVSGDNTTSVDLLLDPGSGAVWGGPNPAILQAGVIQTTVTLTQKQVLRVRARSTLAPSVTGLSAPVTIVPDEPTGTITATPVPATITANGLTTSDITTGVIVDQYGNAVAQGEFVVIDTNFGTFDSVDENPGTIENEQSVEADGRVRFRLRSEALAVAQTATVTMASVNGDATGSVQVNFAQVPAFLTTNPPVPDVVFVGGSAAFRALVRNSSTTGANLNVSTKFEFSDGPHTYSANLAAPKSIAAGDTATLVFASAPINVLQTPTFYAPTITFVGQDQFTAPFSKSSTLPAQSVLVSAVRITDITAPPFVSRGLTDTVRVSINNPTPSDVTIDVVTPSFTPGTGNFVVQASPDLPRIITAGNTGTVRVPVTIGAGTPTVTYQIDAFVSGTVGGKTVIDPDVAPFPRASWTVQAGAALSYVQDSLDPGMVSQGQVHAFDVRLSNSGQATLTIETAGTKLVFTDGDSTYTATLPQPIAIAGLMEQTLAFASARVPFMDPGSYPVEIQIAGVENGVPFADTLSTLDQGDQVTVETPANIVEPAAALSPDRVSRNQSVAFVVNLNNTGGASVVLDPSSTTIGFNAFTATLNPISDLVLDPGPNTITFASQVVGGAIPTGLHFPTVHVEGTENGVFFSDTIVLTDGVTVETAPALAIIGITPSQPTFTADQTQHIAVRMVVQNNGQAAVTFTEATLAFVLGGVSKTSQFVPSVPTQFVGGATLTGGEIDTVFFDVSDAGGAMSTGLMTIEGEIEVLDTNSSLPVFSDPDVSSKGSLLVQSPANVQLLALVPSQDKVTAGMAKDFAIDLAVRNAGGSDVALDLTNPSTLLSFTPSAAWVVSVAGQLAGGGTVLSGGETDTISFTILQSGTTPGVATIGATVAAVETNSGANRSATVASLGSIEVEQAGFLAVTDVQFSTATLTNVSTVPWEIVVDLQNTGHADVDVTLPGGVNITWANATTLPTFTVPSTMVGGGKILSEGATGQIVIPVMNTGLYPTLGLKQIDVAVNGVEVNSGLNRQGSGSSTVLIQEVPQLSYIELMPDTVSMGASVEFQVNVRNFIADAATVQLDRTQTQLRFFGGSFAAQLDAGSPDTIAESTTETLVFESATIPQGAPVGPQPDVELELHWIENGRPGSMLIAVPPADLVVQEAPDLSIVSITPSRATVTRSVQPPWNIVMEIHNGGDTAVDLDLSAAATKLTLNLLQGGTNVTGQYTIVQPSGLATAGGTILAGGATDSLFFTINATGTATGVVIVSGQVVGENVLTSETVSDNTFDGGSGSFTVQTQAQLRVVAITPEQPTVSVGQTTPNDYDVEMVVQNLGGAAVNLTLTKPATNLAFFGSSGWATTLLSVLKEGGVTVPGGETRTVVFTIGTSGDTFGMTTIHGVVRGVENNTGTALSDSTADGGSGQIELVAPSDVQVVSVVASRASVTQGTTVDWTVTMSLRNNGGQPVLLTLPDSVALDIQHDTGGTTLGTVNGLEEGGTILAGGGTTGTLVIPVTNTGTFSSRGLKTITASVGYVDDYSNEPGTAQGTGSITIQVPPNLQYVPLSLTPDPASNGAVVRFEVDVQNVGPNAATARLDRGQTRFFFPGYSAFLDTASVDTIASGVTQTLVFEDKLLDVTAGEYDPSLALVYTANGEPKSVTRVISGELTVDVQPQLQINTIAVSQGTVNARMTRDWTATMRVTNNGPSAVDLDLAPGKTGLTFNKAGVVGALPGYVVVPPTGLLGGGGTVLGMGQTGELVFVIDSTGIDTGAITVNGRVEGEDQGSLDTVFDDTFDGGAGAVIVQTPANLVTTMSIVSPLGAQDGSVSINQQFVVGAVVHNAGQAVVTGPRQLTLSLPSGFSLPSLPGNGAVKAFVLDDTTKWTVQAPPAPRGAANVTATITTFPTDINDNETAASSQPSASVAVSVDVGGALSNTNLVFSTPVGAVDGTISTGQSFQVLAAVTPSADALNVQAQLLFPAGFTPVGATVRALGNGNGTEITAPFDMIAPAAAVPTDTIKVRFTGIDRNTSGPLTPVTVVLPVEVVLRTRLTLLALVTAPPDAVDRKVTVGTPFTITANVANDAFAAGMVGTGQIAITLPVGKGYQLAAGEQATKSFSTGVDVEWVVEAAPQPSGVDDIRINIVLPAPADENSGLAATVAVGQVTISMVTEGAAVGVSDVSDSLGLDARVVPGGAVDVRMLGIDLEYSATDPLAADAEIDTFSVTILGKSGSPLSDTAVSRTLRRLFVQLGDAAAPVVYETTTITGNPVVVSFEGGGPERVIAPGDSQTAVIGVDLAGSPAVDEIRVQLRGDGINIKDQGSNQPLGVVDVATGEPLDGRLTSRPLVILSNNFEEYAHNYPNPFRAGSQTTHIAYFLRSAGNVSVKIYSIAGDLVYEEAVPGGDPRASAGAHEIDWDGRNMQGEVVRNGIYVCVLNAGSNSAKFRIAVAK